MRGTAYIALFLAALPLAAEFRSVEMGVGGLDCASCAGSVERALRRIRGVESASFRLADSTAVLALKAGNTVALDQVRDALKGLGYTPKDAKVSARGVMEDAGFKVTGPDRVYKLDGGTAPARGKEVTIEGTVPAPADRSALEVLRVSRILEE
jgi:copper chaperone CopZ